MYRLSYSWGNTVGVWSKFAEGKVCCQIWTNAKIWTTQGWPNGQFNFRQLCINKRKTCSYVYTIKICWHDVESPHQQSPFTYSLKTLLPQSLFQLFLMASLFIQTKLVLLLLGFSNGFHFMLEIAPSTVFQKHFFVHKFRKLIFPRLNVGKLQNFLTLVFLIQSQEISHPLQPEIDTSSIGINDVKSLSINECF